MLRGEWEAGETVPDFGEVAHHITLLFVPSPPGYCSEHGGGGGLPYHQHSG